MLAPFLLLTHCFCFDFAFFDWFFNFQLEFCSCFCANLTTLTQQATDFVGTEMKGGNSSGEDSKVKFKSEVS